MYENELKPCPFCGEIEAHVAQYNPEGFAVECGECACRTNFYTTPENAIKAWNERTEAIALSPCPFCGGQAKLKDHKWDGENTTENEIKFFVECSKCHCVSLDSNDIKDVIDAWNTRVSVE